MDAITREYNPHFASQNEITQGYRTSLNPNSNHFASQQTNETGGSSIGLEGIAKHLHKLSNGRQGGELAQIRAPQKKLYVMIIGNHSAGKSSFINWYLGDKV